MYGGIEMKKTLIAFLCTFIALPAVADNYIKFKASAIEDTINTMVPESRRLSVADEYQKQMDSTTGKISVLGIYRVCAAAGFNINNTNGYNDCRLFINTIAEKSGFGSGSANQQNCANKFNGIWSLSPDGKQYQCVGKDGHKLAYHASCDGAGGDCIRDFSSLQTQEPNAREFIQAYGQQKNLQLTCWYTYDNRRGITSPLGQDYIKCSAGGKAYEFEFDNLIQDPGKTAVESENTALCEMFGGKIVKHPDSNIEKQWQSCEVSREICNGPLHNLAVKIGHNVMYQGYCHLSRTVKKTSVVDLKTLPGVDSRVFYNTGAQMRAGMAKQQTEEYLRTKFPNETHINCDPNPKILNAGFGIDRDYIMTCTVGSKQVDFIFHDLTEGAEYKAVSGEAKMACAIVAERVNGKNCHGLDQAACTDLDKKLKQIGRRGTDYKPEQGGCILLDTQKEELVNLGLEIAGGVALTVATGGYGVIVVAASIATDIGFEALNQWLRKIPYNDYQEFMKHANKCSDTDTSIENQYCIADVLNNYYALITGNLSDLAPELQASASAKLHSMVNILSDKDIISTVSPDNIPTLKQGRNYISIAAMGALFTINPDKLAAKGDDLIRQATRLGKQLGKASGNIDDILRKYSKQAVFRPASDNSLGHDYYRIMINDNDDVAGIIADLQKNGYFISANQTVNGEKFIAISEKSIFQQWEYAPKNWLNRNTINVNNISHNINGNKKYIPNHNLDALLNYGDRPLVLGSINGKDVFVDPKDFGQVGGRPIIMVSIHDRKIPFYISTGTSGKLEVATGKWEFFGGIDPYTGWFNKGSLDDINNHYNVQEFKQIANMLDSKIGDVRNVQLIAETAERFRQNGQGTVAIIQGVKELDLHTINQSLQYVPEPNTLKDDHALRHNIDELQSWFNSLKPHTTLRF